MPSDRETAETPRDGVDVRRGEVKTPAGRVDGWIATFDGTEGVGHGREEALRQLVVNVAKEGPL